MPTPAPNSRPPEAATATNHTTTAPSSDNRDSAASPIRGDRRNRIGERRARLPQRHQIDPYLDQ